MHYVMLSSKIPHPPFPYESREDAIEAVETALETSLFRREEPDSAVPGEFNTLLFQLGPGTVLRVISDEVLKEKQRKKENSLIAQPGIVQPADEFSLPYKLIIQTVDGQMEPLDHATRGLALSAVEQGVLEGYIYHKVAENDEIFVQTGPGTLFIVLSTKNYDMQRRSAMESAFRASNMSKYGKA